MNREQTQGEIATTTATTTGKVKHPLTMNHLTIPSCCSLNQNQEDVEENAGNAGEIKEEPTNDTTAAVVAVTGPRCTNSHVALLQARHHLILKS
jgi:hypothetical protein